MRIFSKKFVIMGLLFFPLLSYAAQTQVQQQKNITQHQQIQNTEKLVNQYYDAILKQDLSSFMNLLSDNVIHEINQGPIETGKPAFKAFMEDQFSLEKISIKDLIILTSPDGKYAMVRYQCSGSYNKTAKGYPPAKGQHWEIPIVSYFKIDDGKIAHVSVYYNIKDWVKQIS